MERVLTSPLSLIFSSSLYGAYHLASRVLPLNPAGQPSCTSSPTTGRAATHWRFCMSMNDNISGGSAQLKMMLRR